MRPAPITAAASSLRLLGALLVLAGPSAAQQNGTDGGAAPVPVARAGTKDGDVSIDGVIEESAWDAAPLISGFVQGEPIEGGVPIRDTHVRVLFDDEAIYIAARLWDHPDSIRRVLNRRDEGGPFFDYLGISIDPNLTRRNAYSFRINAAGVQQDMYVSDDVNQDQAWNAVWASAVRIDSLGWTAEARIPLSQLRYDTRDGEPQTWGVNFHRRRVASGELTHFAQQSRRRQGGGGGGGGGGSGPFVTVSQFARLEGVVVPSTGRRIELRPYALSSFHRGPAELGDPYFDGSSGSYRVGSEFRLGLGSSFTVDATVNPDFGQVEADPAVINLTAFESFFQERRPFFVEDGQVFQFRLSGSDLFYSRRIGRPPHGGDDGDADFVDAPDAATILGAAKLTGRTSGGLSIGALAAVTDAETARGFVIADGSEREFAVEPRTEYGVLSARQDLNGGASLVTGIFTALHRGLPANGDFDHLTDRAFTLGTRFEHQWQNRVWRLWGFLAGSHVEGTPEALLAVQTSSNHYFQRPDATRSVLDPTRTSLGGREWRLEMNRQNASWTGGVWAAEISDGFEINDLGFSNARERLDGGMRVGYLEIQPGRILRDYSVNLNTFYNFSHEALDDVGSWSSWRKAYVGGSFNLGGNFTFLNYHGGNLNLSWQPDQYSRSATRGGPIMIQPGSVGLRLGAASDRRKAYSGNVGVNLARGARGSGNDFSIDGNLQMRPSPPVQIQINPSFSVQSDAGQYVTATSTLPYEPTFGRRYFFGDLERKTVSLETRVNYAFSPVLTLQVYSQGLLSSGDYVRYKQLAQAGTYDFTVFEEGAGFHIGSTRVCPGGSICRNGGNQEVDLDSDGFVDFTFRDRDFNVRSLIGNAVLRWEYRPGSTLFFVWQRVQDGGATTGDFDFGRDVDALWGAPAHDRFIVKLNYWLGL